MRVRACHFALPDVISFHRSTRRAIGFRGSPLAPSSFFLQPGSIVNDIGRTGGSLVASQKNMPTERPVGDRVRLAAGVAGPLGPDVPTGMRLAYVTTPPSRSHASAASWTLSSRLYLRDYPPSARRVHSIVSCICYLELARCLLLRFRRMS